MDRSSPRGGPGALPTAAVQYGPPGHGAATPLQEYCVSIRKPLRADLRTRTVFADTCVRDDDQSG
jgi:hypothetical protein